MSVYGSRAGPRAEFVATASQRPRRVMDAVGATAFAFADVEYRLANGSTGATVLSCAMCSERLLA